MTQLLVNINFNRDFELGIIMEVDDIIIRKINKEFE